MKIIKTSALRKETLTQFFTKHWGSPQMVVSSGIYQCDELDGFVVIEEGEIMGLITYIINGDECEIMSLDSLIENRGIGSALIKQVELEDEKEKYKLVKLITTNDNLNALGFYQKRGYRLTKLYGNAVEQACKLKPEIPFIADNGIPIRDELLLVKEL
ncbi:GNAT family N-acetyltransferase [Piscibacillus halophilus]|uniref:GNAT family N-acetyltransferase n=1 Tax=Piscibacillus halophilus TaxID=571933 RepID=UPI001588CC24|nr:GNAT family N-acetyltransferase [Piscibacillus halophilus]